MVGRNHEAIISGLHGAVSISSALLVAAALLSLLGVRRS
jgi:hypothetical protein